MLLKPSQNSQNRWVCYSQVLRLHIIILRHQKEQFLTQQQIEYPFFNVCLKMSFLFFCFMFRDSSHYFNKIVAVHGNHQYLILFLMLDLWLTSPCTAQTTVQVILHFFTCKQILNKSMFASLTCSIGKLQKGHSFLSQ